MMVLITLIHSAQLTTSALKALNSLLNTPALQESRVQLVKPLKLDAHLALLINSVLQARVHLVTALLALPVTTSNSTDGVICAQPASTSMQAVKNAQMTTTAHLEWHTHSNAQPAPKD